MTGLTEDQVMAMLRSQCQPRNVRFGDLAERFTALARTGALRNDDLGPTVEKLADEADASDEETAALVGILDQVRVHLGR